MELIIKGQKSRNIKLGSVVFIPAYKTSYIVHVADRSAVASRRKHEHITTDNLYMLARIDGTRPYQSEPFTQAELKEKMMWLKAEIYSPEDYQLQLIKR